ncbi:FitA-like ribbon-helix-helix domain-containing protein [Phenylobacterium sp.]|jgi:predicted transcriptional regulator|uniref:FitA-like ribbon-helix-helix domain-containing protein n=1 Tax=Phenylobacterium sp. TaxID=1871053 RepID=UPI002F41496B
MADGELTLKLDDETAERLRAAADHAGVSVEAYVLEIIADDLDHEGVGLSRVRLLEYDQTGEYLTVEEAMAHFDRKLQAHTAKRG